MAWPNPFRRRTPNTRTCWGYTFELTSDHLSLEQSNPLKQSYDVLAEECLDILDKISPPPRNALPRNNTQEKQKEQHTTISQLQTPNSADDDGEKNVADGGTAPQTAKVPPTPPRDLYALLRDNATTNPKLNQLWTELNTIPEWVDWEQIARGQDVFYRYGGAALTGLAYQSLLGGMGAARVVETLARTGGFSTKVARRRLFETTQHILQCTRSLESLQPGGEGFESSVRVRFLHAAVRKRILKLAAERPGYYDVEAWGVPINDLDSIATIGTFSATLIWISFPRQGLYLRRREIEDYIALWRYIGYLVGCPTEFFATPAKAKAVMESLLMNEIAPTDTSKILANNIIKSLESQPPAYASADMLIANAYWLNGQDLCRELGLPRPSLYYFLLAAGQCLFFMGVCYSYRSFEALDRRKIDVLKRVFYDIIVGSRYGLRGEPTYFEFKYVPQFNTVTEMNDGKEVKMQGSYIEHRNLKALLMGVGVISVVGYCGTRLVLGAVGWALRSVS